MTAKGIEGDIRRKAAQHSRDAYHGVKAVYVGLIKTSDTRQVGNTLKAARNELGEITFILKNAKSDKHGDVEARLRAVDASLSALESQTVSQALIDIRHAVGTLQKDVIT